MDFIFWLGIGIGAILSFAMSVLANIYSNNFQRIRYKFSTTRNKSRINNLTKRLNEATVRQSNMQLFTIFVIRRYFLVSATLILGLLVSMYISDHVDDLDNVFVKLNFYSIGISRNILINFLMLLIFTYLMFGIYLQFETHRIIQDVAEIENLKKNVSLLATEEQKFVR